MFQQIKPGNTFGGRILVPYKFYPIILDRHFGSWSVKKKYSRDTTVEDIQNNEINHDQDLKFERQKSHFTIIADSANVEIWTLDRNSLVESMIDSKINEDVQKLLYSDILTCKDEDRGYFYDPDISYIQNLFKKWDGFK